MEDKDDERIQWIFQDQPPFSQTLGIRPISASLDEVVTELDIKPPLGNRNGVLHGGAIMSFADNAGGTLASINLKPGHGTTTLESKTNFLRPIQIGDVARATSKPIHVGRTTIVVQTTITRSDGKVAAVVTQTQMVFESK